jgi:hypothetical protein
LHFPVEAYDLPGIDVEKLDDIKAFLMSEEYALDALLIERYPLAEAMGESNLYSSVLTSPSNGEVEEMLYILCGNACHDGSWKITDTAPVALLDDEHFQVYFGFILWATVLLAGLGFELLFWMMVTTQGGWSDRREIRWWLAQFVFPLCSATCLGLAMMRNFMALPFLVFGLFKFGMPEIISYMYVALHDTSNSRLGRLGNYLNSTGIVLHHSSATIPIVMLLAGVFPADRHVLGPSLVLLMQHWFVLTKYVNFLFYNTIELALEAWFEWMVLSDLQYLDSLHWTLSFSALGMLTAHWLFLIAAGIELIIPDSGANSFTNDEECGDKVEVEISNLDETEIIIGESER